jgi:Atypical PilZ domain, cyclic di-GMP receptor
MRDHGDTIILRDELAYVDCLPVHFDAQPSGPDSALRASMAERNLRLLLASAALDEHGQLDKKDDDSPHAADLQRMEQKINLLLDIVGYLLAASQSRPAPTPIQLNARGAVWEAGSATPAPDATGILHVYLRECLVQPLMLTARVSSVRDGETHLEFDGLPDSVTDHLEKLVFRRHRRRIAGARQGRRS